MPKNKKLLLTAVFKNGCAWGNATMAQLLNLMFCLSLLWQGIEYRQF